MTRRKCPGSLLPLLHAPLYRGLFGSELSVNFLNFYHVVDEPGDDVCVPLLQLGQLVLDHDEVPDMEVLLLVLAAFRLS